MSAAILARNAKRGMVLSLDPNEPGRTLRKVVEEGPGLLSLYWDDKTRTGCSSEQPLYLSQSATSSKFYQQAADEWTKYLAETGGAK